jgi:hypothetical protein
MKQLVQLTFFRCGGATEKKEEIKTPVDESFTGSPCYISSGPTYVTSGLFSEVIDKPTVLRMYLTKTSRSLPRQDRLAVVFNFKVEGVQAGGCLDSHPQTPDYIIRNPRVS